MSHAANPNKPKKDKEESETAAAARQEKVVRERIRRLIITLGDDNKKVLGQIRGLAGALDDDVELHGDLMATTVMECAQHLPLKSSIYAAWVARMAAKHESWVSSVVEEAIDALRSGLRVGDLSTCQMLLRFLACLGSTGTLGLSPLMGLLKEVLSLSDGLRSAKGGDLGVFLSLSSLAFLSPKAHAMVSEDVNSIVTRAGAYLASRDARWKPLLRVVKNEDLPDRLEALLSAVHAQKKADWSTQTVLHVPGFEPSLAGHAGMPPLPLGVTAEDIKKNKIRLQIPLVTCPILTRRLEKKEGVDEMTTHDRWVLEDYILLTIERFGRDVEECCKQILKIPVLHPNFEAIVIEIVFSQMLRLPNPSLLPLFYLRLLETMMEKQASTIELVERAYTALFESSPDLDEECLEVLAEGFAYHLMHNGYKADWSPFTGDSAGVQSQRVLRRSFERLLRLSFHQNLLHRLPEAVHVYVPPEPLAVSTLPVQAKPEFTRMVGVAKIKDPNEAKVLKLCHRLLKMKPKEEQKEETTEALDGTALPVNETIEEKLIMNEAEAIAALKRGREGDVNKNGGEDSTNGNAGGGKDTVADGCSPEKRQRTDEEGSANGAADEASEKAATSAQDTSAPMDESGKALDEERKEIEHATGSKRKATQDGVSRVKEEVKEEERGVPGVKAVKAECADKAKEDEETEFGKVPDEPWSLEAVAELMAVAVLQNGSKTPTHMSKMLDGHLQVFKSLRPNAPEEAHNYAMVIVRSIFDFWRHSGQRLEITLETLLHRGIVTPKAVVEQALAQRGAQGCDSMSVWNLINSVARKSLEHSQSIRADLAIAKRLGKTDIVEKCRRELDEAIHSTAELFSLMFTGLVRNHQDFEETDIYLRKITLDRVLTIGRKYHAFIKPLIEAAESRIPGVAHNPDIAAIFDSLGAL